VTYHNPSSIPDEILLDDKEALLALLLAEQGFDVVEEKPISPRDTATPPPLSFAQQRLWFLDQLEPGNPAYNIPLALRFQGALDVVALEESLNAIVRRHEALRTTFKQEAGQPVQAILPQMTLSLPVQDGRAWAGDEAALQAQLSLEAAKPFDLEQGPLLRATLFQVTAETHILLLTIHHIIADGWSLGRLLKELMALYAAYQQGTPPDVPPLSIQYADFAVWQREFLSGETLEKQLAYWREQLTGDLPVLDLPTDHPRPALQTFRGAQHLFTIPAATTEALRHLNRREGVTLFMTLLAAFKSLLYRYTGQEDILVGTPIANRNRQEIEPLIGFFANTLLLRTHLSADLTFSELLKQVQRVALGAYDHQDVPIEKLTEVLQPERDLSRNSLFQVMFILQNAPMPAVALPGLTATPLTVDDKTAKFDLTLALTETPMGLNGLFEYNTDLFKAETIARMAGHWQTLLAAAVADPTQPITTLPLLTPAERAQLVAWNETTLDYPRESGLHQLFEVQAARNPEAIAVRFEGESLTYSQLNKSANRLAAHLRSLNVGPDVLVGIYMERGLEMMVALLGILKAGGAYVPLDPTYPQERLAFMVQDAQLPLLLTQQRLVDKLPPHEGQVLCLDADWPTVAQQSEENLPSLTAPHHLAYVIYTSGSTGQPKGVQIPHQAVVNFLTTMADQPGLTAEDRLLAVTTLSFDIAVLELFLPLTVGGQVVLASRQTAADGRRLAELIEAADITVMQATPATWRLLVAAGWVGQSGLKMLCGGEALPRALANELLNRGGSLWNMYGPTETTIWSTIHPVGAGEGAISIGRPIGNTQLYVLDNQLHPVPIGVPGDLYIGGDGLARGYLRRPELTADRFIPDPFSDEPTARLYKTGDLAYYQAEGTLGFLGRLDHQVKVRGFRIELGEIETKLRHHAAINQAVVATREETPGDQRLVVYYTAAQPLSTAALRHFLSQSLPDYMVPAIYVHLEAMPLTPNGKINRQALPQITLTRPVSEKTVVPPDDLVELQLTHIFEHILEVKPISVTDNFFELGGHSLLTIRLLTEIEKTFGRDLPLMTIFQAPTVEQLATVLRETGETRSSFSLVPLQPYGLTPPLFFVPGNLGNVFVDLGHLVRHLKGDHPLYGFQDGIGKPSQIEGLATHYIEEMCRVQPAGPYLLGGICSGAVVAYEMAQQLLAAGQRVEMLALIEPARPPAPGLRAYGRLIRHLVQRSLGRLKHQTQQLTQLESDEQETYRQLKTKLIANLWGMTRYQPRPYAGSIQLFFAKETFQSRDQDPRFEWAQLATETTLHIIPGSHDTITGNNDTSINESHMQALAERLQGCLAQLSSEGNVSTLS